MTPYIRVENISKYFGDLVLYENLSLTIPEGHRIALIAKNGAGKTTLLNMISSEESPDKGEVIFKKDITVGYLHQDPVIPGELSVLDAIYHSSGELAETIKLYEKAVFENDTNNLSLLIEKIDALGGWDFEHRAKSILSQLRITDMSQKAGTLSGGELKRLALAIILIDDPDVLILDEPTNHLDLEMAEWLEDYLMKNAKTLFMVTHDRYFLDRLCTDIYEIDHKELYSYKGGYSDYVEKRAQRLEQFNTEVDKAKNLFKTELDWMRRMPQARGTKAKYRKDAFCEIKDKAHQKRDDKTVNINISSSRLGGKIFEVIDLNKSFDERVILKDFSYNFARYEKLGIIGKNGTGKSTFLNILTGAIPADSGVVDIGDSVRFGYYRQSGIVFDEQKKVIDVVREISEVVTMGNGTTISSSQFLTQFLFPPETQYNYIYKLSGGERRRLYLLTILMQSPNFLILDEPTNDLDIMTLNVLEDYLSGFDGCLIIVSHDRYFMDKVVGQLLVFEGNGLVRTFAGNYTQYRNKMEEEEESSKKEKEIALPKPIASAAWQTNRKQKMSYKEKQAFDSLEMEISKLEQEKIDLESRLNGGELTPIQITEISERHGIISAQIDDKSMRWLELSELSS